MTGRSALIGLVSNAFSNPYVMSIIDVFTQELQRRNLRPLVFNMSGQEQIGNTVALMCQYRLDGIVIASSTLPVDMVQQIGDSGIPIVMAFGRPPAGLALDTALADNVAGGRLAARRLLQGGYRSIGFIGAPRHVTTSQDRLAGFEAELAAAGMGCEVIRTGGYSHGDGAEGMTRLLAARPRTDAVFCADDLLALGAIDGLRAAGRDMPATGVIGFNDIAMAGWPAYRLTTLRTRTDQVVSSAIDLLETRIDQGERQPEQRLVGCEIVARQSCR